MTLEEFQRLQFVAMRRRVDALEARVRDNEVHSERAEIAGAWPRYDALADLPTTVLTEGMVAFVRDSDGGGTPAAYIYDGANWRELTWT